MKNRTVPFFSQDGIYSDKKGNTYVWNGSSDSPITIINKTIVSGTTIPRITRININPGFGDPTGFPPSGMSFRFGAMPLPTLYGMIGSLQQGFTSACSSAAPIRRDPLILDLDGDGIETINVANGAQFDHDANGFAEQTGWVSPDDGLLVMDRDGSGTIDSGKELFGDQTILNNGTRASNGFQALADLDSNKDGKIDANDSAFNQLKVWQDVEGDGYSSADELKSLSDIGIQSINLNSTPTASTDPQGNTQTRLGSFEKADGTTGNASDVWFKTDNMYTIANEWLDVPDDIAELPDLQGYGNVIKLHARPPLSFLTGDRNKGKCYKERETDIMLKLAA